MKRYIIIVLLFFLINSQGTAQVNITLRAGQDKMFTVSRDEPLILKVTISNQQAQADERWNMAAKRRLDELESLRQQQKIKPADLEAEKKQIQAAGKQINVLELGSDKDPWTNKLSWNVKQYTSGEEIRFSIKRLPNPSTNNKALLDENGYYTAYFGLAPGDLNKFAAGVYQLFVSLDSARSNTIQVEIKEAKSSNDQAAWMRFATFYWHANEAGKGLDYIDRILSVNPTSLAALSLKGDLLVMLKDYNGALKNYEAGLKQFYLQNPSVNEPPEFLIAIIDWIKARLKD